MDAKQELIRLFEENVKGKKPDLSKFNKRHDGKEGHWLEQQFNIKANSYNCADILGYELKTHTKKITFGDWVANEYIFSSLKYSDIFNEKNKIENRDKFLKIFGQKNPKKDNRYSWSGKVIPKFNKYNSFGQTLIVEEDTMDIIIKYDYSKDERIDKNVIVPEILQINTIELARWYGLKVPKNKTGITIKQKLEKKFNDKGWFTCKKDKNGIYTTICFGKPINFYEWINMVKEGVVFFDSGMYQNNPRPYSQWRATNTYWDKLIIDIYH